MKLPTRKAKPRIWTAEEDNALKQIVMEFAETSWRERASYLASRVGSSKTSKQCRERYRNYLNPNLEHNGWRKNEELMIMILHSIEGNKWSEISSNLGRANDIQIRNAFYSIMRQVLSALNHGMLPSKLMENAENLLISILALELVKTEYLPFLEKMKKPPVRGKKEKIILNVLRKYHQTKISINEFEHRLLDKFKECNQSAVFPLTLIINTAPLEVKPSLHKKLCGRAKKLVPKILKSTLRLQFDKEISIAPESDRLVGDPLSGRLNRNKNIFTSPRAPAPHSAKNELSQFNNFFQYSFPIFYSTASPFFLIPPSYPSHYSKP